MDTCRQQSGNGQELLRARGIQTLSTLFRAQQVREAYAYTVEAPLKAEHADVIAWVRKLPYFYESPFGQVFGMPALTGSQGGLKLGTSLSSH